MTKKIFHSILLVAVAVLALSIVIIMGCLYDYFGGVQESQIKSELEIAAAAVETYGDGYLDDIDSSQFRLTLIDEDGTVIKDTVTDAASLENHKSRTEVAQALESGEGSSIRYSATLLQKTMYYALKLQDGSVLRISTSVSTIWVLLFGMIQPLLVVIIVALILSSVLADRLSHKIVEPLNRLNLDRPLENDEAYEELSPLLSRINRQHIQISTQMRELQKRTDEFAQVTSSMKEGLVLLDERGFVLSINPAAAKIFATDDDCVGCDFLTVDRSRDMSTAIEKAMSGGHSEVHAERNGRIYQFDVSRIDSDNDATGAVILAFDTTDKEYAERNRREFTANVSHELKTPLQGIIGSAELIENGMVKEEDVPRFIGHIRSEAQRLISLIADIIRLSQLDEGEELQMEQIDLLEVATEAADDIQGEADKKNISVSIEGNHAAINGVHRLLYEVIYNLCDNAVKYNHDGGRVDVRVSTAEDGATASVTVADNGIGIAPEHQDRIFERFYRVDKSHSKASGGTGLGLSIVKHAVQYHHGTIELQSEVGSGTTIKLTFPTAGSSDNPGAVERE